MMLTVVAATKVWSTLMLMSTRPSPVMSLAPGSLIRSLGPLITDTPSTGVAWQVSTMPSVKTVTAIVCPASTLPPAGTNEGGPATAMVVDEIGDIVEVPRDSVEPPVSMIGKAQADFVSGSVYVDDRLVGLVNLGRVLQPVGVEDRG